MAKKTLLEIVQEILSDMDGDVVNSIDDTEESGQVATIVKSTYEAMIANRDWPHLKRLVQVTASGDSALPTHMTVQENIKKMVFLNYNKQRLGETRRRYQNIRWVYPDEFLRKMNDRNNDNSNIDIIIDPTGVELMVFNDRHPTVFTSFDDETLVFDAYDSDIEATLQSSKVQAHAYVNPVFNLTDDFIPDLPEHAFPGLIEEAKSKSFVKLKQQEDPKAEQEAGRQRRWLSRNDWRVNGGVRYPNYGRKVTKFKHSNAFDKEN